jgi:hypothetical protein
VPSEIEAEKLSDLLADARAIPDAAFPRPRRASRSVVDLSMLPVQSVVDIPESTASLVESAEHRFADFSR